MPSGGFGSGYFDEVERVDDADARPLFRPKIAWAYSRFEFIFVAGSTNHARRCLLAWAAYFFSPVSSHAEVGQER